MEMRRLVLVLDGSDASAAAAEWCADHGTPGTEIVAVATVSPVGELMLGLPPSWPVDWISQIREMLDGPWSEPLRKAGLTVRTEVVERAACPALIETAEREDADAIVVGKRTRGFLSEHLSAPLAADLVHHSHRPVIVVPTG